MKKKLLTIGLMVLFSNLIYTPIQANLVRKIAHKVGVGKEYDKVDKDRKKLEKKARDAAHKIGVGKEYDKIDKDRKKVEKGLEKGAKAVEETTGKAIEATQRVVGDTIATTRSIVQKVLNKSIKQTKWKEIPNHIRFNEAVIFGSHESFQSTEYGYQTAQTLHFDTLTKQLEKGARYLDLRIYAYKGDHHLCHGDCNQKHQSLLLPGKKFMKFKDSLIEIRKFLEKNKKAVLVVAVSGSMQLSPEKFEKIITQAKIKKFVLSAAQHEANIKKNGWPTYGELRKNNTRLIFAGGGYKSDYVFQNVLVKPKWMNNPIKNHELLVLELGVQTSSAESIEKMVKGLQKGADDERMVKGLSADYWLRGLAGGKLAVGPMEHVNTKIPYLYTQYIHQHGFKPAGNKKALWKGQWPTIIASDFISIGDLSGAVQCINKNLLKLKDYSPHSTLKSCNSYK